MAVVEVADLARLFRVTEKSIYTWVKDGMPVVKAGKQGRGGHKTQLDLEKCVEWYFASNHEKLELDRARTRLANEQSLTAELKNAETQRDLVPLSLLTREFAGLLAEIRTNALAIPAKLAPELEGQTIGERKATLERSIFELLDRAVEYRPGSSLGSNTTRDDDGSGKPETAAGGDGERMGRRKKDPKPGGRGRARKVANKPG